MLFCFTFSAYKNAISYCTVENFRQIKFSPGENFQLYIYNSAYIIFLKFLHVQCTYMFTQSRLSPCIGVGQLLLSCSSQPSLPPSSRGQAWDELSCVLQEDSSFALALEARGIISLQMGNTFGALLDINNALKVS